MSKNIGKKAKITLIVIGCFLALLILAYCITVAYLMIPVADYYSASERTFLIPDLSKGFIPQGFCYDENTAKFLVSGYFSNDKPSAVYVVNKDDKKASIKVNLATKEGEPFYGHAGGVALYEDWVYIAGSSDYCIYVYSYSEILNSSYGDSIKSIGEFSLENNKNDKVKASFVSTNGKSLVVGEYYSEPKYKTVESHKVTIDSGEFFGGIAVEFNLSKDCEFGIEALPTKAYSLPEKVQGILFVENDVYLSTSSGMEFSHIYQYDYTSLVKEDIELLGESLPLYVFSKKAMTYDYKVATMSEEMVYLDDKLYIMCEAASNKHFHGKLTFSYWCYAVDLEKMQSKK